MMNLAKRIEDKKSEVLNRINNAEWADDESEERFWSGWYKALE